MPQRAGLHHHEEKETLNPLDLEQWTFYVVTTARLEKNYPKRERIVLPGVLSLNPHIAKYGELKNSVIDVTTQLLSYG